MPKQGDGAPWTMSSSYSTDVKLLRSESVADPNLRFDALREPADLSPVG